MNSLGDDIVRFVTQTLRADSEAVRSFDGFIITSDAVNFSVGANLMQLLLGVQDEEWDEIDMSVRGFQAMTSAVKFCSRPVVSAPFGLCLGGATEISMHAGAATTAHGALHGTGGDGRGFVAGGAVVARR